MRVRAIAVVSAVALALCAVPGAAQTGSEQQMPPEMAAMMAAWQAAATPGPQHQELAQAAGTWKMTVTFWMPGATDPMTSVATATRRMILGGRYLEEKVSGDMMGMPFEGYSLTGYDNVKGKYWSIWMDSSSTGNMYSEGEKDSSGAIVLQGSYADAVTKATTKVKSIQRREGNDKEKFEMWEDRGGQTVKTMEITSVRQSG
jgi:hypothetical protein